MQPYQHEFIDYAIACNVLRFGDFTLKSGRESPYFFNAGLFNSGRQLARLGRFYAESLVRSDLAVDVLYGPAYKGIPLVCATVIALADQHKIDLQFAFNRKEAKDHGEGGLLIGAPLHGSVLIVDDVITAGTSVRESVDIINAAGAKPCGVLIALDREERGQADISAIQEVTLQFEIPVISVISLSNIIDFLKETGDSQAELERVESYRERYGIQGQS